MKTLKFTLLLLVGLSLSNCQNLQSEEPDSKPVETKDSIADNIQLTTPCNNPKSIAQLMACAAQYGVIDSTSFLLGIAANGVNTCAESWIDSDTVLKVWYSDSVTLYRVQPSANTPTNIYGSWFTNINAYKEGYTKQETLNKYALSNCPTFNYTTCECPGGIAPADSLIQYEVTARIGPGQELWFGIVGPNRFGAGGNLQWHLPKKASPPYRVVNQARWP